MNDRLKNAVIDDIAVKELIFYDENNIEDLQKFCFRNAISYLPSRDRMSVYALREGKFIQEFPNSDQCLAPNKRLFDQTTALKFAKVDQNEIKFVVEKGLIKGVVHIVDYNNEFVAVELYRAFFRFENGIRTLLQKHRLTNKDFIRFVRINRDSEQFDLEASNYWTDRYEKLLPKDFNQLRKVEYARSIASQFHTFYFSDLLEFAINSQIIDRKTFNPDFLKYLRNYTAHNRHFVSVSESEEGQLVYDFEHLNRFISNMNLFFAASDKLVELLETKEEIIL